MNWKDSEMAGHCNLYLDNLSLYPAIDLVSELHLTPIEILAVKQWQDVSGNVTKGQGSKPIVH